jgi:RES domain-containing protein
MILWRISNHADLSGVGGLYASARWHTQGKPVVYLAETPSAALLEILVHLELQEAERPDRYRLLKVEVDEGTAFEEVELSSLSSEWQKDEQQTRARGDAWAEKGETVLLRVPSAIAPETWNWLLNPRHKDAAQARIIASATYPYDPRIF